MAGGLFGRRSPIPAPRRCRYSRGLLRVLVGARGRNSPGIRARGIVHGLPAAALLLPAGCSLTEVEVAVPEDVIVAEVQVVLTLAPDDDLATLTAWAFLHRTYQPEGAPSLTGAVVEVSADRGRVIRLEEQDSVELCVIENPIGRDPIEEDFEPDGSCYRTEMTPAPFAPGDRLSLRVTAPDGRVLTGASRVPGAFSLVGLDQEDGRCRLEPDTGYRFRWSSARGAWAYLADARFEGLTRALAPRGIEAPDTLYLLGLAIGREDTTIVFPRDFGVFEFFGATDEERDVIRELQKGLPEGSSATVAIAAADRNWVNWARGGNFNPSGEVRIPSVFGDGTGVFATGTRRRVWVKSTPEGEGEPPLCGVAET